MFEKLYDECMVIVLKSEMQPEEDTRNDICEMVNKISKAWCDELITDEENDSLIDLLK